MSANSFLRWFMVTGRGIQRRSWSGSDFPPITNDKPPVHFNAKQWPNGVWQIDYWFFYGYQSHCAPQGRVFQQIFDSGSHDGDWEHIIVTTAPGGGDVAYVTYYLHGDYYTRKKGSFEMSEGHPVVFVGGIAHASYHRRAKGTTLPGLACDEWSDPASGDGRTYWTGQHLRTLKPPEAQLDQWDEWIRREYQEAKFGWSFKWGPDGVSTKSSRTDIPAEWPGCKGVGCGKTSSAGVGSAQHYNQCEAFKLGICTQQ